MPDEEKVEAQATPAAAEKKGVDVNALAGKGKEGLGKGLEFINKLFGTKPATGIFYAQILYVVFALLVLFGGNPLYIIIGALLAVVGFFGLAAVKKSLPTEPSGDATPSAKE